MKKSAQGLTLIELLLVMLLLSITIIPMYFSYTRSQAKQGLKASSEQLADIARRAHVFAREAKDKKAWGIKKDNDTFYSLVSKAQEESTWTVVSQHKVESLVKINSDFFIQFEKGTGSTSGNQLIILENKYGIQFGVNIYESGIVEVGGL